MYCGIEGIVALIIAVFDDNIDTQEHAFAELEKRLEGRKKFNTDEIMYMRETGMSVEQIAKILGIQTNSLYCRLWRAKNKHAV